VLTYDSFAAWAWSFSGAQVESLWLPGPFKLGFDPAKLTGRSYLDRNKKLIAAFDGGQAGICAMAHADGIDTLLLTAKDGAVGLHDRTMAAPYRLDPVDRPSNPLEREVAPGTTYLDLNAQDRLRLSAGTSVTLPWVDPGVVSLGVLVAADATGGDILSIDSGSDVTAIPGRGTSGTGWEYFDVAGVDQVTLTATTPVELLEVVAFGPWPGKKPVPANGPFVTTTANLCDSP
jgi:hypothetical protein